MPIIFNEKIALIIFLHEMYLVFNEYNECLTIYKV